MNLRIGPEIIKHHTDHYRRLRNLPRYLLGSLNGFKQMRKLIIQKCHNWKNGFYRVNEVNNSVREKLKVIIFILYTQKSIIFVLSMELSSFCLRLEKIFYILGDPNDLERRGCRTALDILFNHLTAWLTPILCFTAEEA